jgi:hypothetical protein
MDRKPRITGKMAMNLELQDEKRKPFRLEPANENQELPSSAIAGPKECVAGPRKAPPRVRKPESACDRCFAPTTFWDEHRKCLRETLGNTLADEFVDVILRQLIKGLHPGPFGGLDEATLNAALATVDSLQPDTEHLALLAVEIVVVSFRAQRFLQLSGTSLMREHVDLYGNYAIKIFRVEGELRRTYERLKCGNKQTVEVHRHVHLHYDGNQAGGPIVNASAAGEGRPLAEVKPLAAEGAEPATAEGERPLVGEVEGALPAQGGMPLVAEEGKPLAAEGEKLPRGEEKESPVAGEGSDQK